MKNIYYKLILLTILLSFTQCSDELELRPQQSLSDAIVFQDPLAAEGVLFGTYSLLQDLHSFGSMPQLISDYVADNVFFVGSFTGLQEINTFSSTAGSNEIAEIWRDNYEPILAANAIIANVDEVPGIGDDASLFKGEAHFIRALCYFQLVNFFAQPFNVNNGNTPGVPLYLEPFVGEVILLPRSTVAEVHSQILQDLEQAQNLLPDFIEQGRTSSQAALALESRLRLYRGEWQQAADLANQIINGNVHSLAADYSFFNALNDEYIFSIENTEVDFQNESDNEAGSGSWDSYYEPNDQGGRGDAPYSADFIASFGTEVNDLRLTFKEEGTTFSGVLADFTLKYNDGSLNTSDPAIIRYSEIILNRAEALAELNGINQESLDHINSLRNSAGVNDLEISDFSNTQEFIDAILLERRKELAFEGHRRMDLLRRSLPLRTATSAPPNALGAGIGITAGDARAIFPIPQREIDLNPNISQNDGY